MKTETVKKKFYILIYAGSLTQYVKVLQKLQEDNPELRWRGTWLKPLDNILDNIPTPSSEDNKRNILIVDIENNDLSHMVCNTDAPHTILGKIRHGNHPCCTPYDVLSPSFSYPTEEKKLLPIGWFFIPGRFPAIPVYDQEEREMVFKHMKDLHVEYKEMGFDLIDTSRPRELIFCEYPVTSNYDQEFIDTILEKTKRGVMDAKSFVEKVDRIYISKNKKVEDINWSKDFIVPVNGPADEMQLIRLTDALGIRWLNPKKKPFDPEKLEDGNYYRHIYMNDNGDWLCRLRYDSESKNPNKLIANSTVYYMYTLYNICGLNFGIVSPRLSTYSVSEFGVRCCSDSDVYRVLNKFFRWTTLRFSCGDPLSTDKVLGYLPSWNGGKSVSFQVARMLGLSGKSLTVGVGDIPDINCTDFLDTEFDFRKPLKDKASEIKNEYDAFIKGCSQILFERKVEETRTALRRLADGSDDISVIIRTNDESITRSVIKKAQLLRFTFCDDWNPEDEDDEFFIGKASHIHLCCWRSVRFIEPLMDWDESEKKEKDIIIDPDVFNAAIYGYGIVKIEELEVCLKGKSAFYITFSSWVGLQSIMIKIKKLGWEQHGIIDAGNNLLDCWKNTHFGAYSCVRVATINGHRRASVYSNPGMLPDFDKKNYTFLAFIKAATNLEKKGETIFGAMKAEGPTVRDILRSTAKFIDRNGKAYDLDEVKSLELNTTSLNAAQETALNLNKAEEFSFSVTEAISEEVLAHIFGGSRTQKALHKVINSVYGRGVVKNDLKTAINSAYELISLLHTRPFRDVLDCATDSMKAVMIRNKIMDIILGKSQELYISFETEDEAQAIFTKLAKIFEGDESYKPNNCRVDTNKLVRLTRKSNPGYINATPWDDPFDGNKHHPCEIPVNSNPIPENWRKESITAREFLHAAVIHVLGFWKSLHDESKKTHFEGHKEDVDYILEHIPANGTGYDHPWLSEACVWHGNNFVTCEEMLSMNDAPYHSDTVAALVKYLRYRNKWEGNE